MVHPTRRKRGTIECPIAGYKRTIKYRKRRPIGVNELSICEYDKWKIG